MCLIVAKPSGVPMPNKKNLKAWFKTHPDGFGLAYLHEGRVHIVKGAMTSRAMCRLINKVRIELKGTSLDDLDLLLHFRQATNGQIEPKNCHPFPITSKENALSSLEVETDIAVAHNGIIWDYSTYYKEEWTYPETDKTDTQEFIEDYLVGLGSNIWNPAVQKLIEAYTESKFALLSSKGITYIGQFITDGGLLYSNGGYKPPVYLYEEDTWKDEGYEYSPQRICEFCEQPAPALYCPPKCDSLVCQGCFVVLEGRQPREEDLDY